MRRETISSQKKKQRSTWALVADSGSAIYLIGRITRGKRLAGKGRLSRSRCRCAITIRFQSAEAARLSSYSYTLIIACLNITCVVITVPDTVANRSHSWDAAIELTLLICPFSDLHLLKYSKIREF
ncbi:hypothetical protein J6590_033194 [Homalodisca vitripennis]|nr:hypothetical protein J6590_033194 [Homalodisca vitripennis]